MKHKVIGIAGPARIGKDTAADFIKGKMPIYQIASFADPIKEMLRVGLGLSSAQLYGDHKEDIDPRYGVSIRYLMQTLGTEWGRNLVGQEIWVNAMNAHIESSDDGHFIIPDVRFESEAEMIRENGVIIHIYGEVKIGGNHHVSEKGIKREYNDLGIENCGTIDEYYLKLDKMLRKRLK